MIGLVGIRRVGWWVLLFVLSGVIAGCGSDGEASAPSATTTEDVAIDHDDYGLIDTSAITAALLPEITADDIEIIEGDAGMSYRYVFPTRELSDSVSFDMEARWDPVDGGFQSSLTWVMMGDETSPSVFPFVVSLPKSFAGTVDDIVFDPQPDEILELDPVVRWEFDARQPVTISAISNAVVAWNRAGGDDSLVPVIIMNALNDYRIHSELSGCARLVAPESSMLTPDVSPVSLMLPCYLKVVAVNASTFGGDSCTHLGEMIGSWGDSPTFVMACESVVQFATGGSAAAACDAAASPSQRADCRSVVWGLLAGDCPAGDPVEQQICLYEAAAAVNDEGKCDVLARVGSPWMANDCRAAITKDPSWCARTEDPKLGANCCENFRGTDNYDTCLASIAEATTEQDTTTTTDEETTTTDGEEVTTTEAAGEDHPPAIPAGTYVGSFNEAHLVAVNGDDFLVRKTNTITVTIDDEGPISGGFTLRQEGSVGGCPGWIDDYSAVIDAGQQIGSTLPQVVSTAVHYSGQDSLGDDLECLDSPRAFSEQGTMWIELTRMSDGVLVGALDDFVYVPFELRLAP